MSHSLILKDWTVVLAEDDPDSLEITMILLQRYGAQVYAATNGKDALALIRQYRPQLVISDLSMPDLDGWELLASLQKDPELVATPVIALTAHALTGDRERVLAAGFRNYLTKPLFPSTFHLDLARVIGIEL